MRFIGLLNKFMNYSGKRKSCLLEEDNIKDAQEASFIVNGIVIFLLQLFFPGWR